LKSTTKEETEGGLGVGPSSGAKETVKSGAATDCTLLVLMRAES